MPRGTPNAKPAAAKLTATPLKTEFYNFAGTLPADTAYERLEPLLAEAGWFYRLVFLRLIGDDGLPIPRPHIVIRAETPSYDPRGTRIVRKINGPQSPRARRYQFEVRCKRFGLRAEIPSTSLETEWMDAERGLILYFPLELMEGTETK